MRAKIADEQPYYITIEALRLGLLELQVEDQLAHKMRQENLEEGWEDNDEILHKERLPYVLEAVKIELINKYQND